MYYTMVCYAYYGHTNYNSTSVARNVLRCLMLMKEASIISCAWIGVGLGCGLGVNHLVRLVWGRVEG